MPLPSDAFDHPEIQALWAMAQETKAVFFGDVKATADAVGISPEAIAEWLQEEGILVLPEGMGEEVGEEAFGDETVGEEEGTEDFLSSEESLAEAEASDGVPSSLDTLFRSLRWKTPITPEEERALFQRVQQGDLEARERLIEGNLRLVMSVALDFANRSVVPLEDLVQEGCLGLIRAVDRYDWRKGTRFSTYAVWWIRQYIVRAIAEQSRLIHLPFHLVETLSQVMAVTQRLTQELGRHPTPAEIAEETGLSPEKVEELQALVPTTLSLDMPVDEEEQLVLEDIVPDPNAPSPEDVFWRNYARERLRAFLEAHLNEREWQVLQLRFGLLDGRTYTLDEIGQMFKITGEAVRHIEQRALEKLRGHRKLLERLAELMA
jgi:RNA polymerase primary sigma factor